MARTVDTSSTFENWRQNYNSLASDVGDPLALTTADKSSVVNAINYIMDQYFYFQDFDYDGSDGATSNTVFSGADNAGNTLAYSSGKILVFKNGALLRSGTDYTATNGTSITLASSANNADVIRFSVFTGSYENVGSASSSVSGQWTLAGGTIYNHNTGGIVINADSSITTSLTTSDTLQIDGDTYHNGSVYLNAQNDLRLRDNDSSHYAAIQAPATISANYTLTLPADDGTSGQTLQTDGSGVLSWASAGTAPDITIAANNSANETVYPVFVDGATGTQGLESDTGLTYNPSTGTLTSTIFVGALTGNVTGNVTGNTSGTSGSTTGNAATATALATGRTIGMTGDVVWTSASFDGSGNVTAAATIQTDAVDIGMLSATGTASSSTFLRGDNSWVTPTDTNTTYSAGTGLSLSSTTFSNTGVTSIVAGSNVSISGATGAVTVTATDTNTTYSVGDGGLTTNDFTNADHSKLNGIASSANNYSHPSHDGDDFSVDTGALTGAVVVSDIDINVTTDSSGHVTDANGSVATRTLTLANLGYSGATNANNYSHPNHSGHVTSSGDGATTIASGVVTSAMIVNGTIVAGDLAADCITAAKIGDDVINSEHYAADSIDAEHLAPNSVNTDAIIDNAVRTAHIQDNQVTAAKIPSSAALSIASLTATGDITSNTSSDMALKENIINIPNPLEKISKIGGYMFDWKDHGYEHVHGKGHDTGIIAQEIEAILPEIVNTRETGIKAVNYMKLIPLLVESIKELKTELDKLKSSNS